MFTLEYCDDPEKGKLITSDIEIADNFDRIFDSHIKELDRFLFLVDMHNIIDSCKDDFLKVRIKNDNEFWRINKLLLNYANAVYGYKEYLKNYKPKLSKIADEYFKQKDGMYSFICELRNYIIHQTIIIRDYNRLNSNTYFDIDAIIKQVNEYQYSQEKHKECAMHFCERLIRMKENKTYVINDNLLDMKAIVKSVSEEMSEMKERIYKFAFEKGVKRHLDWFFGYMPRVDGKIQYSFVVDKERGDGAEREPNLAVEDFTNKMIMQTGEGSVVCKMLFKMLEEKGYTYFYDGDCELDEFIKRSKV